MGLDPTCAPPGKGKARSRERVDANLDPQSGRITCRCGKTVGFFTGRSFETTCDCGCLVILSNSQIELLQRGQLIQQRADIISLMQRMLSITEQQSAGLLGLMEGAGATLVDFGQIQPTTEVQ